MNPELSRCDVLDRLEEASTQHGEVEVVLRDGRRFVDRVRDVITESGVDDAIFERTGRIAVREIARCERAPGSEPSSSYDDKL